MQGGRVPVREALAQSIAPCEEKAARWSNPSGRSSCVKRCFMGGASCKVAESQWERLLHEALVHGRGKLLGGRVPVGKALVQSVAPCEKQSARWPSSSERGSCVKCCSM
ncbi:hypothetical protein Adt_35783 [Abeliophyllum distichum]|uniref:Uncharacterized protein n=1 Tax=Abeliophyllum distichum TaxID=126358 RepID=A0ABD1QFR3_9LAMI